MIEVNVKSNDIDSLRKRLAVIPNGIEKAIGRATKRTADLGKTNMIRQVTDASHIKPQIAKKDAKKGGWGKTGAVIELKRSGRLGTRHFKGQQEATGFSWQIGKDDKRLFLRRGFWGPTRKLKKGKGYRTKKSPKWKGNAFIRVGEASLPIIKIVGVSPWGYYTRNNLQGPEKEFLALHLKQRIIHEMTHVLRENGQLQD